MSSSPDPDLRDVFRLLYDEDIWASDEDAPSPPADVEVETVEADVEVDVEPESTQRYSKRRFADALNELFLPAKRSRIYNPPETSPAIFPSTAPFPELPPPATYAPFSPLPLLARLRTYRPTFTLPYPLTPLELALKGWVNTARDEVGCLSCNMKYGVGLDVPEKIIAEVARRLGQRIADGHGQGCPWRVRTSPRELHSQLRNLLHPMLSSSLAPLALRLQECITGVQWKSPLTLSQIQSLSSALSRQGDAISDLPATLALLAWYPHHPNQPGSLSSPPLPTEILQCRFCERRVGLWAFRDRPLDVVEEHLVWCPVRPQISVEGVEKGWWEGTALLSKKRGVKEVGNWVRVSERLEKKPWRRSGEA